jgi:mRNA interferase MazF
MRSSAIVGEKPVTFWKEAGLLKPSMIKPVLATVEKRLILRKLGRFREEDRLSLQEILHVILGM